MDKNKIIKIIMSDKNYSPEEKEIISQIQNSIMDMEAARNAFDFVKDNTLIDLCIHKEDEAKARYSYFIGQAKDMGIRVNAQCMVEELNCYGKW